MKKPQTKVKLALADSGLKQRYVSRLTGIDEIKLSRIVNGATASPEEQRAIALVLRVSVDELFPEVAA